MDFVFSFSCREACTVVSFVFISSLPWAWTRQVESSASYFAKSCSADGKWACRARVSVSLRSVAKTHTRGTEAEDTTPRTLPWSQKHTALRHVVLEYKRIYLVYLKKVWRMSRTHEPHQKKRCDSRVEGVDGGIHRFRLTQVSPEFVLIALPTSTLSTHSAKRTRF